MARLRALTLLVSVLSASAFAPFGWASKARTEPVRAANYLESVSSLRAAGLASSSTRSNPSASTSSLRCVT